METLVLQLQLRPTFRPTWVKPNGETEGASVAWLNFKSPTPFGKTRDPFTSMRKLFRMCLPAPPPSSTPSQTELGSIGDQLASLPFVEAVKCFRRRCFTHEVKAVCWAN